MTTLLQLNTSIFVGAGESTKLANDFVSGWMKRHPGTQRVLRDLSENPVPHLTAERAGALRGSPRDLTPEQREVVAYSDALIDELRQADVLVLGLPMYNFGVPSMLRAYFDHIARAGVTFRYTAEGPVGLLTGKKAYVLATRGGKHAGTPADYETGYVRHFLRFIGISDVTFIYAEGLGMGETAKQNGLSEARASMTQLLESSEANAAA